MKEEVFTLLAVLFKNELDQWPHQFMRPEGFLIFGIPAIVGFIDGGFIGMIIFGSPLITVLLLQRFIPI